MLPTTTTKAIQHLLVGQSARPNGDHFLSFLKQTGIDYRFKRIIFANPHLGGIVNAPTAKPA